MCAWCWWKGRDVLTRRAFWLAPVRPLDAPPHFKLWSNGRLTHNCVLSLVSLCGGPKERHRCGSRVETEGPRELWFEVASSATGVGVNFLDFNIMFVSTTLQLKQRLKK